MIDKLTDGFCSWVSVGCLFLCLFILSISVSLNVNASEKTVNIDLNNPTTVERGKLIYKRFCSLCHGRKLKGQADWRTRKADGKLPAPPHDESGHTWHHPDSVLFAITKYGLVPPNAPDGYLSDMPAWKDTLKDSDIRAVLVYIKSTWPKDILEQQQEINRLSLINR